MVFFQYFAELLKFACNYAGIIFSAAAVYLFAPQSLLEALHISYSSHDYRDIAGFVFLISGCALLEKVWNTIKTSRSKAKSRKKVIKRLHALTQKEKDILLGYIFFDTRTQRFDDRDGVVNGLIEAGVLIRHSLYGSIVSGFDVNITDVAWEYLKKNPDLLR